MSERHVFRCDYCGKLTPLDESRSYFTPVDELADGTVICTAAVYCSPYCGRTASSRAGTGRG